MVRVRNNRINFDSFSLPARPMIGTIGVAPSSGSIASIYPGPHGGNMDCKDIAPGAKLYLPVQVDGALLALGDIHASMGDGETSGGGIDIGADVRLKVDLLHGIPIESPIVETDSLIDIIHNFKTLEGAIRGAVLKSVRFLESRMGLSAEKAMALVGAAGDVRICQAAGIPLDVVVRVQLPKSLGISIVGMRERKNQA